MGFSSTGTFSTDLPSVKTDPQTAVNRQPKVNVNITKRQDYFVYVKIERTGSSTLSNIFSSYGYRHKLNMMMSLDSRKLDSVHQYL